jgi:hypothetical protein
MKRVVLLFLFFSIPSNFFCSETQKKMVRGCVGYGFMAEFSWVLNFLDYCSANSIEPVIYWDTSFSYYAPQGYNGSLNAWEYYFEPVSKCIYERGDTINKDIHYNRPSLIWDYNEYITRMDLCSAQELRSFKSVTPGQFATHVSYPHGHQHLYNQELRAHVKNSIIDRYIRIKQPIQTKIDTFVQKYMVGRKTIGIHLRGKHTYGEVPFVSLEEIFKEANAHAAPDVQFLIATDQQQLLNQAKKNLKGNVIAYSCPRFDKTTSPIPGSTLNPRLGEEVLIETILLSQCDFFIHTLSMVSTVALYFNPTLKHKLLY